MHCTMQYSPVFRAHWGAKIWEVCVANAGNNLSWELSRSIEAWIHLHAVFTTNSMGMCYYRKAVLTKALMRMSSHAVVEASRQL
eukprot:1138644-Pelagomonas_calceolata.AAC.4